MGFKPPRYASDLSNTAKMSRWARATPVTPSNGSVGFGELDPGLLNPGEFLVNRGGSLQSDGIIDADIPATIARDSEVSAGDAAVTAAYIAADTVVANNAASDLADFAALPDPFPQYLTHTEGDAAYQAINAALLKIFSGTGTPEGAVTAGKGSLFLRTDGGAGTTLYVKESGAGNTGWAAK